MGTVLPLSSHSSPDLDLGFDARDPESGLRMTVQEETQAVFYIDAHLSAQTGRTYAWFQARIGGDVPLPPDLVRHCCEALARVEAWLEGAFDDYQRRFFSYPGRERIGASQPTAFETSPYGYHQRQIRLIRRNLGAAIDLPRADEGRRSA